MAIVKIRLKSGFGDNGAGLIKRRMVLEINGEAVAATDTKTATMIAKTHGVRNIAPYQLSMGMASFKGIDMDLKDTNTAILKGANNKEISKEITFTDGKKVILSVMKRGMISKILTGKFYGLKAKIK